MPRNSAESDPIRYVLVVHGIGEQLKNETVISVVSRFAEARRGLKESHSVDVLTLGMASGQTGADRSPSAAACPWMEFRGVPARPRAGDPELSSPFLGEKPVGGDNLRFVDICWSDLLEQDIRVAGQSVDAWTDGLIGRLERKSAAASQPGRRVPVWIVENLRTVRESFLALQAMTRLRGADVREHVVTEYLGDIQLYGEYAHTRGRAVLRFHHILELIEQRHKVTDPDREARYTIIAHSLGTVMSLDALLYAHASDAARAGSGPGVLNLPFDGYREEMDRLGLPGLPGTKWAERVDSFVTLGSPIDKYLVVWWLNYKYLLSPDRWLDCRASWAAVDGTGRPCTQPACAGTHLEIARTVPIRHFNYAEEQDPVSHELDVARTAPAVQRLFERCADQVYNRTAVPLLAHMSYWKDLDLFKLILHRAVDGCRLAPETCGQCRQEPIWFDQQVYKKVLKYSYKLIPLGVIALDFFAFTWAYFTQSWHSAVVATLMFLGTCWLGRKLLDLSMWWRQIQVAKAEPKWKKEGLSDPELAWRRELERKRFRRLLGTWFYGSLAAAGLMTGLALVRWWDQFRWGRLVFMAATAAALFYLVVPLLSARRSPTDGSRKEGFWVIDGRIIVWVTGALAAGLGLFYLADGSLQLNAWIDAAVVERLRSGWGMSSGLARGIRETYLSLTSLSLVAAVVFSYVRLRFYRIKQVLAVEKIEPIDFTTYATD